jgi:hypothetical protein
VFFMLRAGMAGDRSPVDGEFLRIGMAAGSHFSL